ncbi:DNA alkylation repair protein [Synoicihabitans lomoniglobus]|uniref:DNA alkylation repair protein n=1 Tax=Synoicihabitans lomoniglobus TaxID=2909285 RepID=A0AAF0I4Y4_9BACT|nr:DNA alkylation repair protein [Opitutaceae bacterium LMO-M01]WED67078.1 DNA alkylation repair protein [Opitutaceae bacterium LMO-M01]
MAKSPPAPASTFSMKDWFNADRYHTIADQLTAVDPGFDRKRFLQLTLDGLESRELMDRMRQTARAAALTLSGAVRKQIATLRRIAPQTDHGFVGIWFAEFVANEALDQPDLALPALHFFTRYGSAEFAIRRFIVRDPGATLARMQPWTQDDNEHVRRLASEGARPRLPWGVRLDALIADPTPTRPILEALKADSSLYVRKSVANHLNDIAKDHADYVVAWCAPWQSLGPDSAWIVRHGLRTLIKRGHPGALKIVGAGADAKVDITTFAATPTTVTLGGSLQIDLHLASLARGDQTLIIDYVVHYVKASGKASPKVFKWKQLSLKASERITLRKHQTIRDFTTRRHHAGHHLVELQINGQRLAETHFELKLK